jgi:hypothetical protein
MSMIKVLDYGLHIDILVVISITRDEQYRVISSSIFFKYKSWISLENSSSLNMNLRMVARDVVASSNRFTITTAAFR